MNNISCEQDSGEMTNYLLLYFKVHLEGLSKLAQAQVLLQVNKRSLIHCIWESQQLSDSNQLLNFVFYLLIFFKVHRREVLKKISHGSPRKWMSNFKRIVTIQVKFLKISCVRCNFVKFGIHFLGSHKKFFLVLLQMIYHIFSPWKM